MKEKYRSLLKNWAAQSEVSKLKIKALLLLLLASVVFSSLGYLNTGDLSGLLMNLGSEFGGACITFLLIDLLVEGRVQSLEEAKEKQKAEAQAEQHRVDRKKHLILEMSSLDNTSAINAVKELRELKWLDDGSLQGQDFTRANLSRAKLASADLRKAKLSKANFEEADLWGAVLQKADLTGANLSSCDLYEADLSGASLMSANLKGANLSKCNLVGANLQDANLQNANLLNADCTHIDLIGATMPDGEKYTPNTDLAKFTHPHVTLQLDLQNFFD
jgi:uncharacterized protein YjbI with pentapeptide repeats